jgi:hypothetical protein
MSLLLKKHQILTILQALILEFLSNFQAKLIQSKERERPNHRQRPSLPSSKTSSSKTKPSSREEESDNDETSN